jgi:F-type H+-transporting ATPase subunit a
MLLIEVVSHLVRPISLALRLRGNISGDHIVMGIFSDLTPYFVPVIFYGLGFFVAFVQAFVFCLLTMVYITLSTAHDH